MKPRFFLPLFALGCALPVVGCKKSEKKLLIPVSPVREAAIKSDVPLLPVKAGDFWNYAVHLEIPADTARPGTPAVDKMIEKRRTYLGKISPGEGFPEADCFEITTANFPAEREFVDIHDDKILMRGSMVLRPETTKPQWYDHPIPFVTAGLQGGDQLQEFNFGSQIRTRKIQVVGREEITVPAGKYSSIRLLMKGMDGPFELRRIIWFCPGIGIVKDEKTRYHADSLILRETQELAETSLKPR